VRKTRARCSDGCLTAVFGIRVNINKLHYNLLAKYFSFNNIIQVYLLAYTVVISCTLRVIVVFVYRMNAVLLGSLQGELTVNKQKHDK